MESNGGVFCVGYREQICFGRVLHSLINMF